MKYIKVAVILILIGLLPVQAVNVVCSIPDFVPIVKAVGREKVNVTSIMPPGSDPHSFTLTKSIMDSIETSDLILLVNSEFLHFEEKISEKYGEKCLDFKDYRANGAHLDRFPKYSKNPHGYWLKLDNGIAIAKTVAKALSNISPEDAEYFERNLHVFVDEINDSKEVTNEIVDEYNLKNKSCVAVVPGVCYIIQNMGMKVEDVLLGEELGFASGKSIANIEKKLKEEYDFIVIPEFMKNSKAGEIAKQLSIDTGKPIIYVKFVMANENESYIALHYKNLIRFVGYKKEVVKNSSYEILLMLAMLVVIFISLLKIKGVL